MGHSHRECRRVSVTDWCPFSPEQAQIWLKVLRETWYHCYKHTLRASNLRSQQGVSLCM